jgi:hypothetical protein
MPVPYSSSTLKKSESQSLLDTQILNEKSSLPVLRKQVDLLFEECSDRLSALPPPLQNEPTAEMFLRISDFTKAYHNVVNARDDKSLTRKARERYERFKLDILGTGPDFRPWANFQEYTKPPLPTDEEKCSNTSASPMDLRYVRKIARQYVFFGPCRTKLICV